jgi:hypothetical protein
MFRFPQRFLLLALLSLVVLAGFGFDFFWQKIKGWHKKFFPQAKSKFLFSWLLPFLIITLVLVDLLTTALFYLGNLPAPQYFSPPQSVDFLKQDPEIFRIYSVNWPDTWFKINRYAEGWQNNLSLYLAGREMLWPNLNAFWGIASAQDRASWEGGMLVKENQNLANRLLAGFKKEGDGLMIDDWALKIFGLQNVKYFLSFESLTQPHLSLVKEIKSDFLPPLKIYQNNYFLPVAFGVFQTKTATSSQAILNLIFSDNFAPAKEVILERADSTLPPSDQDWQAAVKLISRSNGQWLVDGDFPQTGYLFLSQTFYPGWQAKIDGQDVVLERANYAFTALKVPAGRHQIAFIFKPLSYWFGWILTLITFLLIIIYLIIQVAFKLSKKYLKYYP